MSLQRALPDSFNGTSNQDEASLQQEDLLPQQPPLGFPFTLSSMLSSMTPSKSATTDENWSAARH